MEKEKKKAKSWGQNKMNESTMKADAEQSKEDIIKKKVLAYDRSKGLVQGYNSIMIPNIYDFHTTKLDFRQWLIK